MKLLKKFKGKQMKIPFKKVSGGLDSYYNIRPKEYKSKKEMSF